MPPAIPLWATLLLCLLSFAVGPILQRLADAWLRRRQTDAETRQAAAAADLSTAQTLTERFEYYDRSLKSALARITALETHQEQLQAEVDDWKAAVAEEPEPVQQRIRQRLRKRAHSAGPSELVINSQQTTIEGSVAGGDIGTATIGSVTTPERIPPP